MSSQYAIERMPSYLLKKRIKQGYKVYKDLCNVLDKQPGGSALFPSTWRSYPEIKDFIDIFAYAQIILEVREKGINKLKKVLNKKKKLDAAIRLAKKRKKRIEQFYEKGEPIPVKGAMARLKFKSREECIKYILYCPYNFIISGNKIVIDERLSEGEEIIEKDNKKSPRIKKNITKSFGKLIDIPSIYNEFCREIWQKYEGSLGYTKNKLNNQKREE